MANSYLNKIWYPAQDDDGNCTIGEVEDGNTLIGYPDDDVCVEAS